MPQTDTSLLRPLKMRPVLFEKIWGGRRLCAEAGKDAGALDAQKVGESWEVADLDECSNVIEGGVFDGVTLRHLIERFGRDLVGDAPLSRNGELRFPLLVKFIDTDADLSVQVHPSQKNAHLFEGAASKDECWWVLDVDEGAQLASGMASDDVTREAFQKALFDKCPETLLRFVDVKPEDALHITPGTVHAIGKGVFLLEVQEPSDTTFRVWDYERPGLDGKPRELHEAQALQVMHFGPQPRALVEAVTLMQDERVVHSLVVEAPSYRLERLQVLDKARVALQKTTRTPWVVTSTNIGFRVTVDNACVELAPYSTCIIPAFATSVLLSFDEAGDALLCGLHLQSPLAFNVKCDAQSDEERSFDPRT